MSWSGCGAEVTNNKNGDSDDTAVIVSSVTVSGVLALCLCCCCLLIVLTVLCLLTMLLLPFQYRKTDNMQVIVLEEPIYQNLAFDPDTIDLDSAKAIIMYRHGYKGNHDYGEHMTLFEELIAEPTYLKPMIQVLQNCLEDNRKLAAWLLYVYAKKNMDDTLFHILSDITVKRYNSPDTAFREDSFLARTFKAYCMMEGLPYLWQQLAVIINDIEFKANGNQTVKVEREDETTEGTLSTTTLEINPSRTTKDQTEITADIYQLMTYCQTIFNRFIKRFPQKLTKVIQIISDSAESKFRDQLTHEHSLALTASFVVLRFIAPAITTPQYWGLLREPPTAKSQRVYILISKIIQNLANGLRFDKEDYMKELNNFIDTNQETMRTFLSDIVEIEVFDEFDELESPVTITDNIYQAAIHNIAALILDNPGSVSESLSRSLSHDDFVYCCNVYLKPLNIYKVTSERKKKHSKKRSEKKRSEK